MDSKGLTLYYVILMLMEMNSLIWILLVVKNRLDKNGYSLYQVMVEKNSIFNMWNLKID
ncbi:hypothetical protein YPPY103_0531 [Yersinia pestis PY-103]|nr:hypothetical protein YPPY103_0531 [Yersinia pestis PY-103]